MYSYGQFCRTPFGRMRVRKMKRDKNGDFQYDCTFCFFKAGDVCKFDSSECMHTIPADAYFEKPSVGGKDHTSN